MTNAHCSDCGDPIFRYDNQEFCATCEKPVERTKRQDPERAGGDGDGGDRADEGGEPTGDDGAGGEGADAPANIEVTSPSDDARVRFGAAAEDDDDRPERDDGTVGQAAGDADVPPADEPASPAGEPRQSAPTPPADDVEAAVASARADLVATLQRFARAARESQSPAEATAHLEAAREAAEALDELD